MFHPDAQTVSVVMPIYNGMPFLPQALASTLAQTHRPIEVIVVDDGSTDDSARYVRQCMQEHPGCGLRLIQQANAGEPAARNAGIEAATGTWIAALDADDWWEPQKLAKQLAAAGDAGPQCVLVHTGYTHHFPDGSTCAYPLECGERRTGWCTEALLSASAIGHPSILVRREAMRKIGGYDRTFRQACDIDLYFRLSAIGTFAFVAEHLLHYRKHAGQMSASQIEQIKYHHRAVRKFFKQHPEHAERIGMTRVESALAEHLAVKLESLWWRRQLDEFRALLEFAQQQQLDGEAIQRWRSKAWLPNWVVHLKDTMQG